MHIKKGDTVQVISGNDAGKTGRVLRVNHEAGKLVVEGVNRVFKHLKPSRRNPQGGRLQKEMPIHAGKVLLMCPSCRKGRRTGHRYAADGAKERYCKKCGTGLGYLSKAREAYATKKS